MMNFIALLLVHWLADFALQTEAQAMNKSHSLLALLKHVGTYTGCMTLMMLCIFGVDGLIAGFVTGIFHLLIDFITSKITAKLYEEKKYHDFFVVVGADQLLHICMLAFIVGC